MAIVTGCMKHSENNHGIRPNDVKNAIGKPPR